MRTLTISFGLAIVLLPPCACAEWVQTSGPYGGQVNCFAVSGQNLFAGTGGGGGIFLSTNDGTSWTAVNAGLTNLTVWSVAVSDTNLIAGTYAGGVFLSTNSGTSWTAVNTGLTNNNVLSLATSGTNLFAGTGGGGIFLSTNNGTSWTGVNAGLTKPWVNALAVSGTNLFAGTLGGVFLSTNSVANWSPVNTGLTDNYGYVPEVLAFALSGQNLFAGTPYGVFLSTNNGTSWTAVNAGLTDKYGYVPKVLAFALSGQNLFAGTPYGVFLSTNNGTSWTSVNSFLTQEWVSALAVSGTNLFAGCLWDGVFLSTNNGTTWTQVNNGLTNTSVRAFAVSGTNLYAGTDFGVLLSTNGGTSWTATGSGFPNVRVWALGTFGTHLYAACDDDGVVVSTNNGISWTAVNAGLPQFGSDTTKYHPVECFALSGQNLFAGTYSGVFLLGNDGTSWTAAGPGLSNVRVWALAASGTHLFAGSEQDGVFLSSNNGASWTAVNAGLPKNSHDTTKYYPIGSLALSGENLFAGTIKGVFLSTNSGTSWTQSGLTGSAVGPFAVSDTNLFAATLPDGVFLSTNNGTSWTSVNSGLTSGSTNVRVSAFSVSGTILFAGTDGSGVWRRPLSEMITSAENLQTDLPMEFSLGQNYPNPFNPTTTIEFRIQKSQLTILKVFDVLGREVATLVNEVKQPGTYTVQWDASGIASGVYLYRLVVGEHQRNLFRFQQHQRTGRIDADDVVEYFQQEWVEFHVHLVSHFPDYFVGQDLLLKIDAPGREGVKSIDNRDDSGKEIDPTFLMSKDRITGEVPVDMMFKRATSRPRAVSIELEVL